jgi:prevent-host-death family protein
MTEKRHYYVTRGDNGMEFLKFTDFRNHSKEYFEKIEEGESFIIIRKGKPVARIIPFEQKTEGWKRSFKRVTLKDNNKTTLDYIAAERSEE